MDDNGYIELCKDGCNSYVLDEAHRSGVSLKDSQTSAGCNITIHAEEGHGLLVRAGIFFTVGSCGERCGVENYLSITGTQARSKIWLCYDDV